MKALATILIVAFLASGLAACSDAEASSEAPSEPTELETAEAIHKQVRDWRRELHDVESSIAELEGAECYPSARQAGTEAGSIITLPSETLCQVVRDGASTNYEEAERNVLAAELRLRQAQLQRNLAVTL
jgi:hypothetical protein